MTAELLILLHYFKGKAAPLLRCLSCHFLFPHFVLARAGGGSAPGWAGAPGSVPGAMAPLCPSATLGSSSPSSRCLRHPFGPPGPIWGGVSLGWDVQAGCPCRVSPGCPWLLGERWGRRGRLRPPRSRPLFWWRFLGSGVTACYFHSMAPTAALRARAGGLCLAPRQPRTSLIPLAPGGMWRGHFPKYLMGTARLQGMGGC